MYNERTHVRANIKYVGVSTHTHTHTRTHTHTHTHSHKFSMRETMGAERKEEGGGNLNVAVSSHL